MNQSQSVNMNMRKSLVKCCLGVNLRAPIKCSTDFGSSLDTQSTCRDINVGTLVCRTELALKV